MAETDRAIHRLSVRAQGEGNIPSNFANAANHVAENIAINALMNLQNAVQPPPEAMFQAPAFGGFVSPPGTPMGVWGPPSNAPTPSTGYSSGIPGTPALGTPHAPATSPFFVPETPPNQYQPRRGPLFESPRVIVPETPPQLLQGYRGPAANLGGVEQDEVRRNMQGGGGAGGAF